MRVPGSGGNQNGRGGAVAVWAIAYVLAGCGGNDGRDGTLPGDAVVVAAADSARLVEVAGAAAARLAGGLIGPLTAAVEAGGPSGAIDFCAREAQALTAAIQDSVGGGITLRRTTLRPRNAANAPDEQDRRVLEDLHARVERGDTLPQHVISVAGDSVRFYRPLRIQAMCVRCHGPVEQLDPSVVKLLAEHYPADQATGYRDGDLRGVIRVSLPASGPGTGF
jgi:hypothetical protein